MHRFGGKKYNIPYKMGILSWMFNITIYVSFLLKEICLSPINCSNCQVFLFVTQVSKAIFCRKRDHLVRDTLVIVLAVTLARFNRA